MNHQTRITIEAAPAIVWSVLADVERWPEWTSSVRTVELLDGPLAVDHRVRIRQPKFPPVVWQITAVDTGSSFTWRSRSVGSDASGEHVILDDGDGTTTAVLTITQSGPLGALVALLSRRLTKRYVALEASGLKRRSEELNRAAEGIE